MLYYNAAIENDIEILKKYYGILDEKYDIIISELSTYFDTITINTSEDSVEKCKIKIRKFIGVK